MENGNAYRGIGVSLLIELRAPLMRIVHLVGATFCGKLNQMALISYLPQVLFTHSLFQPLRIAKQ